ncbi:MAG: CapA family protein [Candidatus Kerfeldbacteria bacterium]
MKKIFKIGLIIPSVLLILLVCWILLFNQNIGDPQIYITKNSKTEQITTLIEPITLIAVGDIMPGRTVESKILKYNDWLYPFRETYQVTTTGDIVFANLESPLVEGTTTPTGSMVFRTDPKIISGLKYGGFNVLSLANNHIKNQGSDGISNTINELNLANISYTGAGLNIDEATTPAIITINDTTFGFLAYLDDTFVPESYGATETRSGSPFMNVNLLINDINKLKDGVDVVIISMHAGVEYTDKPNQKQIDFAHTAIDNGADLIIGHHPHVVQSTEIYKDGYIIYSLGNFIFDQMWSEKTREGAITKITFIEKRLDHVEFIPIKSFDYSQPRILNEQEGENILKRMNNFTF